MDQTRVHSTSIRLGTRGSLLARTQSQWVAGELEASHPGLRVELVIVKTSGDRITDRPLHELGGKGLFIKELEQALLNLQIDLAVHSYKDMPVTMPLVDETQLVVAAVPRREDASDVLVSRSARTIDALPRGARVGTGSLRRRCQLQALRPDLRIEPVRGNIDTRLRKLHDEQFDALVLAAAGLVRTGMFDASIMSIVPHEQLLPAPGQGALALQCRGSDERVVTMLQSLHDPHGAVCVQAERELVLALQGDCLSPIAAMATLDDRLHLQAAVGARGGELPVLRAKAECAPAAPVEAARLVFAALERQGVQAFLHGG